MPLDKQPQAISQLDLETGRIDAITEDTLEAIALSRERRAALISAAVTGQIKATGRHRATAGAGGG
jgi:type I restriction enzyme S subunit